jgi:hypothetical protein
LLNQRHHIASQPNWNRKADNTDIKELLLCHGECFSDEELKHKRVLEMDDDTGADDSQFQRKLKHAVLIDGVTKIAETMGPFAELPND